VDWRKRALALHSPPNPKFIVDDPRKREEKKIGRQAVLMTHGKIVQGIGQKALDLSKLKRKALDLLDKDFKSP